MSMRKDYRLHELSDSEFEDFVVHICRTWLGNGVTPFAAGPDGGRDAKFNGTANSFPSEAAPISGKVVVQSKHTSNPAASCSDSEFGTTIDKEIIRIEKLIEKNICEHYLLFTNRKVTGNADEKILKKLESLDLQSVHLIGKEKAHSELNINAVLREVLPNHSLETPFIFSPFDLVEVIEQFHATVAEIKTPFDSAHDLSYLKKPKGKNKINKLTAQYYEIIERDSVPSFLNIKKFLENPRNSELANLYHDTADELKQKITVNRDRFDTFDEVLTYLYDGVIGDNALLHGKRRYVSIFLHYMYFDCDIGQHADT